MICPGKPFGLEWGPVVHRVKDELYAGRDTQLIEDTKQVFFYGVLAKAQFPGCVAIAQTLGYKGDNLFFARGKHLPAPGIKNPQRRYFGNQINQESHLFGVGPDMAVGDPLNAPAKQAETSIGNAENPMGARAKSAHHEVAVVGLDQ